MPFTLDCNGFYFFRLYTEINAEVKKHQGDFGVSKSADEIGKEFLTFFTTEVYEVLQGIHKDQKIQAREQLCCIFQVIHIHIAFATSTPSNA